MNRNHITVLLTLSAACAHTASIESYPPGAELYVDGTQVGVTPYDLNDEVGNGRRYEIVIKKPGYRIVQATLSQDEFAWPKGLGSAACGLCTLGVGCIGLFWSWQLKDQYSFVLEPLDEAAPAPSSAPAAPAETLPASAPADPPVEVSPSHAAPPRT